MQSQKLTGVGKLGQIQNMNSIVDTIWPVLPDNAKELIKNVPFRVYPPSQKPGPDSYPPSLAT